MAISHPRRGEQFGLTKLRINLSQEGHTNKLTAGAIADTGLA